MTIWQLPCIRAQTAHRPPSHHNATRPDHTLSRIMHRQLAITGIRTFYQAEKYRTFRPTM